MSQVVIEIKGDLPDNFRNVLIIKGHHRGKACRVRSEACRERPCLNVAWISDMSLFKAAKQFQYYACMHAVSPGCPEKYIREDVENGSIEES
jgi:hypothetical protein